MSDCPHATKDGFHWCALGPRGRPTVACSMWRAGGSQNWQHGWGDCPRVLRRVVRLLVEAGRSAQDCLTYHGLSGKARPQVMSPAFDTNVYRALEDALAAAAALAAIEEAM